MNNDHEKKEALALEDVFCMPAATEQQNMLKEQAMGNLQYYMWSKTGENFEHPKTAKINQQIKAIDQLIASIC